jgi:hypothetical protein
LFRPDGSRSYVPLRSLEEGQGYFRSYASQGGYTLIQLLGWDGNIIEEHLGIEPDLSYLEQGIRIGQKVFLKNPTPALVHYEENGLGGVKLGTIPSGWYTVRDKQLFSDGARLEMDLGDGRWFSRMERSFQRVQSETMSL